MYCVGEKPNTLLASTAFWLLPRLGSAEINGIRDREARCSAALDRLSDGLTSSGVHGRGEAAAEMGVACVPDCNFNMLSLIALSRGKWCRSETELSRVNRIY
jgi:hypothetical protein